jgi:hypothetical protein
MDRMAFEWARSWGATPAEQAMSYPGDVVLPDPTQVWFRAIDVDASTDTLYRWLCQLTVAPYSYDWIDNLGRRSSRALTPGADELVVGQRLLIVFRLASFEPGRHVTAVSRPRVGPETVLSYVAQPQSEHRSRLLVKALVRGPRVVLGPLAAGDLIMMRKQLRTLAALAAATG